MYVYKKTERSLWTVGFYTSSGKWEPESDHDSSEKAAARAWFLNGGTNTSVLQALEEIRSLARTDLKPDIYVTEEDWAKHRLISIAVMAGRTITAAKGL